MKQHDKIRVGEHTCWRAAGALGATRCLKNTSNDGFKKFFLQWMAVWLCANHQQGGWEVHAHLLFTFISYDIQMCCLFCYNTTVAKLPACGAGLKCGKQLSDGGFCVCSQHCREKHPDKTKALQSICLYTMYILNLRTCSPVYLLMCFLFTPETSICQISRTLTEWHACVNCVSWWGWRLHAGLPSV